MEKIYPLSEEFGSNIVTRNSISSFFERINKIKKSKIVIDFSRVRFISRSCADEYLKQKEKSNKEIIERNMSDEVCKMFNLVQTQYKNKGFSVSFKICSNPNQIILA